METNSSWASDSGPKCPRFSGSDAELLEDISFWVEGVSQSFFAALGIAGNLVSCVILTRKSMRNTFNLLLVTLAVYDSCYLFGAIMESVRKHFHMASQLHLVLFPKVLYPLQQMAMTGSVFMTVAIALERYIAVHFPHDYSQSMSNSSMMLQRLLKYVVPVTLFSVLFNVPKFLEAEVAYTSKMASGNKSEMVPYIRITSLRINEIYSNYNNWSRFIGLGLIPFVLLAILNFNIYRDIRARRKRSRRRVNGTSFVARYRAGSPTVDLKAIVSPINKLEENNDLDKENNDAHALDQDSRMLTTKAMENNKDDDDNALLKASHTLPRRDEFLEDVDLIDPEPLDEEKVLANIKTDDQKSDEVVATATRASRVSVSTTISARLITDSVKRFRARKGAGKSSEVREGEERTRDVHSRTRKSEAPNTDGMRIPSRSSASSRRRSEDSLAVIFMSIIGIFLVCHSPRLLLYFHEIATLRQARACQEARMPQFPFWVLMTISVSHLLLVVSSATNMVVYGLLSPKFRSEGKLIITCCREQLANKAARLQHL